VRHQLRQRDPALARTGIGEWSGIFHNLYDTRVRPDVCVLHHGCAHHHRRESLSCRTDIVRGVTVKAVEIFFEHQLAAIGNKHGMDQLRTARRGIGIDKAWTNFVSAASSIPTDPAGAVCQPSPILAGTR